MDTFKILKSTAMPESLIMGIGAVCAGTAAAIFRGEAEMVQATMCMLFAIFTQLAANFAHRYFDVTHQYGDSIDENFYTTDFRLDNAKMLTREGTFGLLLVSVTLGLGILTYTDWYMIIPGVLIYLLIYLTNSGPWPLFRTWLAPASTFLLFGAIGVSMTAWTQVMYDNPDVDAWYYVGPMVFFAIAYGFLAANVQLIHNYLTCDRDRENLKGSFSVTFGKKATEVTVFLNGLFMLAVMSVFAFTQHVRMPWVFMIVPALAFIANTIISCRMSKPGKGGARISRNAMLLVFLFGFLLFCICWILGDPDRSRLIYYPEKITW